MSISVSARAMHPHGCVATPTGGASYVQISKRNRNDGRSCVVERTTPGTLKMTKKDAHVRITANPDYVLRSAMETDKHDDEQ